MSVLWITPSEDGEDDGGVDRVRADVLERTAQGVEEALREANLGVSFGWLERATFNAQVARGTESHSVVRVHTGTVARIYSTFLALLGDPRFLPELPYPDPNSDVVEYANDLVRAHVFGVDPNRLVASSQRRRRFEIVAPTDPLRARTAIGLASIAVDFVLWHELAHVARGHLGVLPVARLRMFHAFSSPRAPNVERLRVLEHDADSCAAMACASSMTREGFGFGGKPIPDVFDSPERSMFYVVLALTVLFSMCEVARPPARDGEERGHPDPELRFWNTFEKLGEYCQGHLPGGLEGFSLVARASMMNFQSLAVTLGCEAMDFERGYDRACAEIHRLERGVEELGSLLSPVSIRSMVRESLEPSSAGPARLEDDGERASPARRRPP